MPIHRSNTTSTDNNETCGGAGSGDRKGGDKPTNTRHTGGGGGDGFLKFLGGIALGAALAFGYVRWNLSLPKWLELPELLKGNLISTATEADLYDLDKPLNVRQRALEVLFQNRAAFAAEVDAQMGHPFLNALYRKRIIREARQLKMQWSAFDKALAKPALRAALERQHGTKDSLALKRRMLMRGLKEKPFLAKSIALKTGPATPETLRDTLTRLSKMP